MAILRTVGITAYKWQYDVDDLGFKYHGNAVMAAICLAQLTSLELDNGYRRQIAAWYDDILAPAGIQRVPIAPGCTSSRHLYQVRVKDRDAVILALNRVGIFPGVHYRDNREYRVYRHCADDCPRARQFSNTVLSLPLHLRLSRSEVHTVAHRLIEITEAHA